MYLNFYDAYLDKPCTNPVFGSSYKLLHNAYGTSSYLVYKIEDEYAALPMLKKSSLIDISKYSKNVAKLDCVFKHDAVMKTIKKYLNSEEGKRFEHLIFNAKYEWVLKLYPVFSAISKFLDDKDKCSFYQALRPPFRPFFYSKKNVDWKLVCLGYTFTTSELLLFQNYICWENASLTSKQLWFFKNVVNWKKICETRHFYSREMYVFKNYLDYKILEKNQKINRKVKQACKAR